MWEAGAFAPGHVTGFFEIRDEATDPAQIGSCGAGFSVARGVHSRVRVGPEGFPGLDVRLNGSPDPAPTTRRAVELLLGASDLHVELDQTMELPVSQGFGMSAAGALSAALATAEALGRTREEAVWAAHTSEVLNRTGLGDAVGAAQGGFELRLEPGVPPYGRVERWDPAPLPARVLLVVAAPEIRTQRILSDARRKAEINRRGRLAVESFAARRDLETFVRASREFSLATRLASEPILSVYDRLGAGALASQCMLGGSVFLFSGRSRAAEAVGGLGQVIETRIDAEGARVTAPRREIPAARSR